MGFQLSFQEFIFSGIDIIKEKNVIKIGGNEKKVYQRNYYRNSKSGKKNKITRKIILPVLAIIFILSFVYVIDLLIHREEIYPNVVVIDQGIGKMNKNQARQIVAPKVEKLVSRPLLFKYKGLEIILNPKEKLGATIDIEKLIDEAYSTARQGALWQRIKERISLIRKSRDVQISGFLIFNQDSFEKFFAQLRSQIEQPARDALVDSNRIIPAQVGVKLNRSKLAEEIQKKLTDTIDTDTPVEITLPVHFQNPDISTNKLLAQIAISQEISIYETSLKGKEENTLYNIQKASEEVNGIILKPDESFSFNQLIGPAEKEDGYKESIIIVNGQFVNGYGGGVCQVSTTLYNAVLLANLQIIERYNHSVYGEATNYVPLGRDAAIFYGYKDLRFRNSLDQQIVIFCEIKDDKLVATIFGEKPLDKNIKIITQDKKIHEYDIIEIKEENIRNIENPVLQEGVPGYSIKTYRLVVDQQGERRELLSQDQYISVPEKVLVN